MTNRYGIIEVALPVEVVADLTVISAKAGMATSEYAGHLVLVGAYGVFHPVVIEYRKRVHQGISGTETQGNDNG